MKPLNKPIKKLPTVDSIEAIEEQTEYLEELLVNELLRNPEHYDQRSNLKSILMDVLEMNERTRKGFKLLALQNMKDLEIDPEDIYSKHPNPKEFHSRLGFLLETESKIKGES